MAEQSFPLGRVQGPWTEEEVDKLRRYLGAANDETIARILGRTAQEVAERIRELRRVQREAPWTQEELSEFKKLYGTRRDEDLAIIFGRPVEAIRDQATELRLAKDKAFLRKVRGTSATRMPRWSDEEIVILEEMYPTESNLDIAQRLDRSVKSVVSKAHNLGLKKSVERLQEMGRENVSLRYRTRGPNDGDDEGAEESSSEGSASGEREALNGSGS